MTLILDKAILDISPAGPARHLGQGYAEKSFVAHGPHGNQSAYASHFAMRQI